MLTMGKMMKGIWVVKRKLSLKFDVKDFEGANHIQGIQIIQERRSNEFTYLKKYIMKVLQWFYVTRVKPHYT